MINEHTAFRVDWMPFSGLKHSGHGTGGIAYSMEDMQIDKMIVLTSKSIRLDSWLKIFMVWAFLKP